MRLSCLSPLAACAALLGCSPPPPPATPSPAAPAPPPAAPVARVPSGPPETVMLGGGCDEAKVAYLKECQDKPSSCIDTSKPAGTVSYGSILNQGAFLTTCSSPPSIAVRVCAAIRGGRAVAVTVTTNPGDGALATCIGKAVEGLAFPASPRLDVTSTVFAAQ